MTDRSVYLCYRRGYSDCIALALFHALRARDEWFADPMWVGKELRLPSAMIDEANRLILRIGVPPYASDD